MARSYDQPSLLIASLLTRHKIDRVIAKWSLVNRMAFAWKAGVQTSNAQAMLPVQRKLGAISAERVIGKAAALLSPNSVTFGANPSKNCSAGKPLMARRAFLRMVAFVVEFPKTPLEPATALPVQIYMWATAAERGFVERTSGATIILLGFLAVMNLIAVILRRRFERRW